MATKFFFPLYFIFTITSLLILPFPSKIHSSTLESDILSLQEIKKSIDPNSVTQSSYLNSWDFSVDPCESTGPKFLGILCTIPLDTTNSSSRITAIELDASGYEGFLTPAIGNLTELTLLSLEKNKFRGPLPETITSLRKLTRFTISNNYFTGEFPPNFMTSLKQLQYLDFSSNRLSGQIPSDITGLRSLTYLSLSNNGFAGRIPNLTGLWQLNTLDLSTNQFYGDMPSLPVSLRRLRFSHNIISGHLTPLKGLRHLKWLDVSDNRLSGGLNGDVLSLHALVNLNVSFNRFTTLEVLKDVGAGSQLRVLDAEGNELKGRLPVNLVAFQNLSSINLARNQLSGFIPKEYGVKIVTRWRRLYLDHNFLSGNLPSEFTRKTGVVGSLAYNCLKCPTSVVLCRGGQKPAAECVGQRHHD